MAGATLISVRVPIIDTAPRTVKPEPAGCYHPPACRTSRHRLLATSPSASPDSLTRTSTATTVWRTSTGRSWTSSSARTRPWRPGSRPIGRTRPRSTPCRAPDCSSRRRGRSPPSWSDSSASRPSGGRRRPRPGRRPSCSGSGAISCCGGRSRRSSRRTWPGWTSLRCEPPPPPWRSASTRSCRGRPTPSSPLRRWSAGCSISKRTSSPRCARRRSPRSRRPPAKAPSRSPGGRRRRRRCPAPRAKPTRTCSSFSRRLLEQYALWCHLRREHPALTPGIRGWISFKLPETLDYQNLVETERPNPAIPEERVGPAHGRRRREGFTLTDPRMTRREALGETHYCLLCHEREKDSCAKGFFDAKTAAWQKNALGISLKGCPAGREDLRDARAAARGRLPRGARARLHRQPDVPRHGPPDLQRLHEGLHLPEAGAGQHPADRDGRPDRRAGAALGRRDLRTPDALEPAAPAPPAPGAVHGPQGPRRRPGPRRVHAGALPAERGLRRRGRGRPEDRAAARRTGPAPTAAGSGRSATTASSPSPSTGGRSRVSAACPSTASPCAGTRTS